MRNELARGCDGGQQHVECWPGNQQQFALTPRNAHKTKRTHPRAAVHVSAMRYQLFHNVRAPVRYRHCQRHVTLHGVGAVPQDV
jgi:hypothetical protein